MRCNFNFFCGVLVFFAFLITGCKSIGPIEVEVIVISDLKEVTNIEASNQSYIDSYSVIKLASTDKLIHSIDQMQIYDNRIFILDKQPKRLLVFDINGEYLNDIGRFGRGEGEFAALSAFYVNPENKTVNIVDPLSEALIRYDFDGKFIERKALEETISVGIINNMRYVGDSKVLCYADPNVFDDKMLFIVDEQDFTIIDIISKSPFKPDMGSYDLAEQQYSMVSGELHFVSFFEKGINSYSHGKSRRIILVEDGKKELSPEALAAISEQNGYNYITTMLGCKKGSYSTGLQNYFESDRFIFCNFMFGESLIWDKQDKTGEVIDFARDYLPGLNSISYGEGNILVKIWGHSQIERFKSEIEDGNLTPADYDQAVIDIVNGYDVEQDNPVLFIFRMKK